MLQAFVRYDRLPCLHKKWHFPRPTTFISVAHIGDAKSKRFPRSKNWVVTTLSVVLPEGLECHLHIFRQLALSNEEELRAVFQQSSYPRPHCQSGPVHIYISNFRTVHSNRNRSDGDIDREADSALLNNRLQISAGICPVFPGRGNRLQQIIFA